MEILPLYIQIVLISFIAKKLPITNEFDTKNIFLPGFVLTNENIL
jgi:hypothetical protein